MLIRHPRQTLQIIAPKLLHCYFVCSQCFLYKSFQTRPTNRSKPNGLHILLVTVNLPDRFRFLGNCPPTPPLSYHKDLQLITTENAITYHNALCWSLSKICISTDFSFSWGHFNSPEKLKTMLIQNFGVTNKEYYGMLWHFL